jgi:hypothetical protein
VAAAVAAAVAAEKATMGTMTGTATGTAKGMHLSASARRRPSTGRTTCPSRMTTVSAQAHPAAVASTMTTI